MSERKPPATEDLLAGLNQPLPFSEDAEKGFLSCLLQDFERIAEARSEMPEEAMHHPANRIVYANLLEMDAAGVSVDVVMLSNWLTNKGLLARVGGSAAISELYTFIPIAAHFPHYKKIILGKYHQRLGIGALAEGIEQLQNVGTVNPDEPVTAALSDCEQRIFNVLNIAQQTGGQGQVWDSQRMTDEWIYELDKICANKGRIRGTATRLFDIDRAFGGLAPDEDGDMVGIAAYPGNGKSTAGATLLENIAVEQDVPTAVFPLEMGRIGISHRFYLGRAGVNIGVSRSGFLKHENTGDIQRVALEIRKKKIFWDWSNSITHADLHARVKVLHRKHGIKCVIIDHLGQVKPTSKAGLNDERLGQKEVMETLHAMRREMGLLIILLIQLNKAGRDSASNVLPNLSHLRGASEIGEYCTHVMFLHRPCLTVPYRTLSNNKAKNAARQKEWAEKVDYYRDKFPEQWAPREYPKGWVRPEPKSADDEVDHESGELLFVPEPWHFKDYEEHLVVNIAKNRHGATPDNLCLRFDLACQRFRNRTTKLYSNNDDYRQVELAGF